jgi:hypothetical protein
MFMPEKTAFCYTLLEKYGLTNQLAFPLGGRYREHYPIHFGAQRSRIAPNCFDYDHNKLHRLTTRALEPNGFALAGPF